MVLLDEVMLYEMMDTMNQVFEQLGSARGQCSHEETQNEDKVLLRDVLFTPRDESVICRMEVAQSGLMLNYAEREALNYI